MASRGPASFSDIGKLARDLLTKDYYFDHKYILSMLISKGMALTATVVNKNPIFVGHINAVHKIGNATVLVNVDTYSNLSTKVTFSNGTKTQFSFRIPDHKSGKLDVHCRYHHAAFNSSIGLNPTPHLELSAVLGSKDLSFGSKDLSLGGEVGFNTASASFTKYNAGISLNKTDFSAALMLMDKGQTLKASYIHALHPFHSVAAEMTHRISTKENYFTIGSSHLIDPLTTFKTRISGNGKIAFLFQRKWMPASLITFSAEYGSTAGPKFGLCACAQAMV